MSKQNQTHAHQHRLQQAQQLLDALASGQLHGLAEQLESFHAMYPHIFTAEIKALHDSIQKACKAIEHIAAQKDKED